MRTRALRLLVVIALLLGLLGTSAAAANRQYIIPDSNTRYLTYEELWEWDYESVGYIMNEIFARHGYNFEPGGKYDVYFSSRSWYTPNENPNNTDACYPYLSVIEWKNEQLCKDIRQEMRDYGITNEEGRNFWDEVEHGGFALLSGFDYVALKANQKLAVYTAPSTSAYRSGKATVSTNGSVYAAGWESGWLLVMYETNSGSVRVGYVSNPKGSFNAPQLRFAYTSAVSTASVMLTDDPARETGGIVRIPSGTSVTYLTSYQNHKNWAYIETTVNGKTARGFIPMSALGVTGGENDDLIWK